MKKLLCLIFGHKNPLGKDVSYINIVSYDLKGSYYSMKIMPCERCCGYYKFVKEKAIETKFMDYVEVKGGRVTLH